MKDRGVRFGKRGPRVLTATFVALAAWALVSTAGVEPQDPGDTAERAIELYAQERYPEARALFEQLDANGRATGPLLYRLAFCLRVAGDREREQEVLGRAITVLREEVVFASGLEPAFYLANTYRNLGRGAEMREVAAAATARLESGELDLGDDPVELFRAGKLYADQQDITKAAEWYRRALAAFADEPDSHPAYVKWANRYLGDVAHAAGDYEPAMTHYLVLTELEDAQQADWDRLAVTLARLGKWTEAKEAWKKAERANPADANRARYAWRLATMAVELESLPTASPAGDPWIELDKAGLEAAMNEQWERLREIQERAAREPESEQRASLANEVAAIRPVFVAACLEYALRNLPIRETAFFGGYAPLIFNERAWALPEPSQESAEEPSVGP